MKTSDLKKLTTYVAMIPMNEPDKLPISYSGLRYYIQIGKIKTISIDGVEHIDAKRYPPDQIMDMIKNKFKAKK